METTIFLSALTIAVSIFTLAGVIAVAAEEYKKYLKH